MQFTEILIPIIPTKRFLIPQEETTIVIKNEKLFDAIEEQYTLNNQLGLPFWFHGKFNVFGCSVLITRFYRNDKKGFVRLSVKGNKLFRISEYHKSLDNIGSPVAKIQFLSYMDQPPKSEKLARLFEKYSNAVMFLPDINVSLENMFQQLDLSPELAFSVISQPDTTCRENLLYNILKFRHQVAKQQKHIGLS